MTNGFNFATDSLFESMTYDIDADSWRFVFANKIWVSVSGFWRLLEKNQIVLVSLDHGHQFGLSNPVDLSELIARRLSCKKLIKIEVKEDTADLVLTLTDEYTLEIFIASTGYETYDFSINGKRYIGLGSGNIATY
jgi:hypothetical protein